MSEYRTIKEFPDYEINRDGIVRRISDGFKPNIRKNGILALNNGSGFKTVSQNLILVKAFYTPNDLVSLKELGFPDYGITCDGKIWSYRKCKWISYRLIGRGYLGCTLHANKNYKHFLVHRILALLFIPNIENKPTVNHIDGNKLNNCITNLEWSTYSENNEHAVYNNLRVNCFTTEDVHEVCKYIQANLEKTTKDIAEYFDVSWGKIGDIRNRKTWTHISEHYEW